MKAMQDRILELALEEELAGRGPPDLLADILQSIRTGRTRSAKRRPARSAPRLLHWAAATAALLVVSGLIGWLVLDTESPTSTSATPLLWVDEDGRVGQGTVFGSGDRIVVPGPEHAVLHLSDGTRVELGAGTALRVTDAHGEPVVELLVGALRLVRGPAETPLHIDVAPTRGVVDPGARIELASPSPRRHTQETLLALARAGRRVGSLRVTVHAGIVTLETPSGPVAVSTGGEVLLRPREEPDPADLPPAEVARALDVLLADLCFGEADMDPTDPASVDLLLRGKRATKRLIEWIQDSPEVRDYIRFRLVPWPEEREQRDVKRRILQILVRDPDLWAAASIQSLLDEDPEIFERDSLLDLAERGVDAAIQRLVRLLEQGPVDERLILPATFFGLRGDSRGRHVLEWAQDTLGPERRDAVLRMLATAGLYFVDGPSAFRNEILAVGSRLEGDLRSGRTSTASWITVRLAYFHEALSRGEPVRISFLGERLAEYQFRHEDEYRTPGQILEALRRMAR